MFKPLSLILLSSLLLTGCGLNSAVAKMKVEDKPITYPQVIEDEPLKITGVKKEANFYPRGRISTSLINYNSTKTNISITELWGDVSEINYHIWRTADGKEKMKLFSSKNKDADFSFLFDIKDFELQRGEYQVEAFIVRENGEEEFLAQASFTFQQKVPILMYHAIDDYHGDGLKDLYVTPANFEKQMLYLKENGYTLLTFERWGDINKVNKPVFVTFDDGMKNNLNAFHVLQKLQDDSFHPTATEYMIAGAIDTNPSMLSSADLQEMVNSGIFSVQGHTMSHADLPRTVNFEEELKVAKEKIEQVTGKPVFAIAYPFGKFDDHVVEETKKYYTYATTTKPGQFIETGQENELLLMQRVRISYGTTINQFAALLK
ncbi:polysaccharide deacetylase family protein [Neobacillus sp. LXY-4]|uniref:polysaccharide deacetylase family protein n=1 Tax=Neobacillus sp. LXY-4 TaxID=3379826 RepID=UPI003EE404F2